MLEHVPAWLGYLIRDRRAGHENWSSPTLISASELSVSTLAARLSLPVEGFRSALLPTGGCLATFGLG